MSHIHIQIHMFRSISAFQIIGCLLLYMASSYTFLLAAVSFAGDFVMVVWVQLPCLMITIFRDDNWNGSVTKLLSFVRNEHNKVQTSVIFFFNLSLTTTMNLRLRGSLGSLNTLNANGGYLWAENCWALETLRPILDSSLPYFKFNFVFERYGMLASLVLPVHYLPLVRDFSNPVFF